MPMIENLKNFIRHGKQARTADSPTSQQTAFSGAGNAEAYTQTQARDMQAKLAAEKAAQEKAQQRAAAAAAAQSASPDPVYNEAAARIVAEEKEARGKLPAYPGLDKYKLILKMGDGAFSNVYKARDLETGQTVAVKVVRKYELNSSQANSHLHPNIKKKAPKGIERANILKEVQIMRNLDHPNVVKLLEFLESRDYYYLVLELCSGGELFHQIVRLTYFSEELSRHVITQVAKSIHYLHEVKGVVHRDIKPENLLFEPIDFMPSKTPIVRSGEDEDKEDEGEFVPGLGSGGIGVVKIADFGLSKVVWDAQTMTPCGTVGYTAPEIVKDERYSKSVDMWALGCVLYTLLCGFPPFYDESIQVLTEKVARGQYTFLSPWWDEISKSAQDLISHLLTVDPDERYTIDEFLQHPWIKESQEETQPASDAPPTGLAAQTPMAMDMDAYPLQTPGGRYAVPQTPGGTRRDFRSPGMVALREVFDVTYAVHRQEEEGARKKNVKHANYRLADLNSMDEDDEDDYHAGLAADKRKSVASVEGVTGSMQNATIGEKKRRVDPVAGGTAGATTNRTAQATRKKGFELNMDNATLLGRRGPKKLEGKA